MTEAAESTATATLSGRELALKRRKAMALHGKAAIAKTASARSIAANKPEPVAVQPASAVTPVTIATASADEVALIAQLRATVAHSAGRARREALSKVGKAALQPTAARPSGRIKPSQAAQVDQAGCGCGCSGAPGGCGGKAAAVETVSTSNLSSAAAEPRPAADIRPNEAPTGRALARARRAVLAQEGKSGLKRVAQATKIATSMPQQDWQAAIAKGATGRQLAMQRRKVQSLTGREAASNQSPRPAGRQRARMVVPAPVKVEQGHTLSGGQVTGTMVERSKKVTGNEPGSCRPITGTEYVGAEQFKSICNSTVEPMPAKVGVSSTLREHKVTGTEVGRSQRVTGDEVGACRGITGTEYLAAERYQEFCDSRPQPSADKVGQMTTAKGRVVSGVVLGRSAKMTGDETGADRAITGTGYSQPAEASGSPEKVSVTHTAQGKPVTGTALGTSSRVTGDEPGACRGITGTEYLALEQFQGICGTQPPATPRKVSVMQSRGDQPVSGSEVGRSTKVTGDEPGSCREITGSQYFNQRDFGTVCAATGTAKVSMMQTLSGRTVTGTEVVNFPKSVGDVQSTGRMPVTGIDYVDASASANAPVPPAAKVMQDRTWLGQSVTGSPIGRANKVTGDESGGCAPISGSPYIGRGQYEAYCQADDQQAQAARVRGSATVPASIVTGDRPGAGGSVVTGDERGACNSISGSPYIGMDNGASQCQTSGRFMKPPSRNFDVPAQPPAPVDFSIMSPARQAQQNNFGEITGTAYQSDRITGPVNKASGLITGTPEFRHRDMQSLQTAATQDVAAAQRLSGEGSQEGACVTGDAWHGQSRVTGTEGASSLSRNTTQRGQPRGAGVNAIAFREIERPAVPDSRITGSSGNTGKGAVVTLSGGARG